MMNWFSTNSLLSQFDLLSQMTADLVSPLLAVNIMDAKAWYAVPLIVAVSLVYGATRHEHPREILHHAFRSAVWVLTFMFCILVVILLAGFWN